MNKINKILPLVVFASLASNSYGEGTSELAKAAQNPIANMISLPFQNNTNGGIGPDDETQNVFNVQPVIPVGINDDWLVITRTIIPVISQPDAISNEGRVNGLGDTTFSAFLSPKNSDSGVTWGVGPIFLLPTATNDSLGSEKWGTGISAVALAMPGKWVVGAVASNLWSTGGAGQQDINLFTFQPFVNYNLDKGWYLTTTPIITANWEANASSDEWTVPLGGGVGKIFKIGSQATNAQIHAYKNIETPTGGAEWQLRLQLQLLFPK